jgi:predicted aspartyl protease
MEFPILEKETTLGNIPDVEIPILLRNKYGYQRIDFLLDTGADFSMLPAHIAEWLDIDLASCSKDRSYGIEGGKGITVWLGKIQVKICQYELEIRCLFSENQSCPYILGRADIFSQFNLFFDNKNKKIRLSKIIL